MSVTSDNLERERKRLTGLAYRMLGSRSDAEDAVQDAYLRWVRSEPHDVQSPQAWLVTITTRICLDQLRKRGRARERQTGHWLPEPVASSWLEDLDQHVDRAMDVSMALMLLLERLAPEERAVLLLKDVMDLPFVRIAAIVSKSEAACRQIAHRARIRVRNGRPRVETPRDVAHDLMERLLDAIESGDEAKLMDVLDRDVALISDGGGRVKVSNCGIRGREHVIRFIRHARLLPRVLRSHDNDVSRALVTLNGEFGILTRLSNAVVSTLSVRTDGRTISEIYQVLDPEKLRHLGIPWALSRCATEHGTSEMASVKRM